MNVTNVFAGDKVREKKRNLSLFENNHMATMGTRRGRWGRGEHGVARREV